MKIGRIEGRTKTVTKAQAHFYVLKLLKKHQKFSSNWKSAQTFCVG